MASWLKKQKQKDLQRANWGNKQGLKHLFGYIFPEKLVLS